MELILENVRCFAERQTISVKPLTLLVGENSAGKSTFLACLSAMSDTYTFPFRISFNDAPYDLGNYDTIASYIRGRGTRAKSFSLGYTKKIKRSEDVFQVTATYRDNKGAVEAAQVEIVNSTLHIQLVLPVSGQPQIVLTRQKNGTTEVYEADTSEFLKSRRYMTLTDLAFWFNYNLRSPNNKQGDQNSGIFTEVQEDLFQVMHDITMPQTLSVAPIRSEPQRTYTEVIEDFSPTGKHIPYALIDFLQDEENKKRLEEFGHNSGLFSSIRVKNWGTKRSDPISVMVTNEGRSASSASNLSDVGYGVSQALPLVVQSVLAAPESRLLLQQPEVHLHPRAQAALGTLFVDLVATSKKQFVVETHSDYILDRVRQEVARGKIAASDVQILYFEREKQGTHVYPIDLDDNGNIVNEPPSYRTFFLQEEYNLLTRAHKNGARK